MHALMLAVLLAAAPVIFDTTAFEDGKSLETTLDGAVVTVTRHGDARKVVIERGEMRDEVTIERDGSKLRVGTARKSGGAESFLVPTPRIIVDGISIEPFITNTLLSKPKPRSYAYVCPRDGAELRLQHRAAGEFKCPLDGTIMRPAGEPEYLLLQVSN
jgi:hypothetical protein